MKKVIMLSSLLFIANAIAVDTRPLGKGNWSNDMLRLEREFQKTIRARRKHTEVMNNEEKNLLETEEGKVYAKTSSDWGDCAIKHGHKYSECEKLHKVLEVALARLQKTEKYRNQYLPALTKDAYYGKKIEGLGRAREFVFFPSYDFDSETEAMLAGINSMDIGTRGKPSTSVLDWSHDLNKIEEEVKKELSSFIENGKIERIENAMPEYQ